MITEKFTVEVTQVYLEIGEITLLWDKQDASINSKSYCLIKVTVQCPHIQEFGSLPKTNDHQGAAQHSPIYFTQKVEAMT